jgi:hypothetical protein
VVASETYQFAQRMEETMRGRLGEALRAFLAKQDNDTYMRVLNARQNHEAALSVRLVVAYYTREDGALDQDFPAQREL